MNPVKHIIETQHVLAEAWSGYGFLWSYMPVGGTAEDRVVREGRKASELVIDRHRAVTERWECYRFFSDPDIRDQRRRNWDNQWLYEWPAEQFALLEDDESAFEESEESRGA